MIPRSPASIRSDAPWRRSERGAVIVLVLVTLLLASFLLAAFIRRTGTELLADARATEHAQLRAEAYSALESALAMVAAERSDDGMLYAPDESWNELLADTGYAPENGRQVEFAFEDESARISLPTADAVTLQTALEATGVDAHEAERTSNALLAWMREGDAQDSRDLDAPDYERNDPPYRPAHRQLRSWQELSAVEMDRHVFFDEDKRPTEVLRVFMRDFSLHSFRHVNLNTASGGALMTLGLADNEAKALEDYRSRARQPRENRTFRSLTEAATVIGNAAGPEKFGVTIEALRVNITVRQGAIAYRLSAVVGAPGAAGAQPNPSRGSENGTTTPQPTERKRLDYPFSVLEIREDIEAPEPAITTES